MAKWMLEMDSAPQTTSSMNIVGFLVIWLFDFEGLLLFKRDGEGMHSRSSSNFAVTFAISKFAFYYVMFANIKAINQQLVVARKIEWLRML